MKVTEAERKESTKRCCGNGCPQRDSAEHEEYAEALIGKRMTENNIANADGEESGLLEEIVSAGNLNKTYKRVKRNNWRMARTGVLNRALTKERLARAGFYDLANAYQSVHVNY